MALYDLVRLEREPQLRQVFREALERQHSLVAREGNSFWNFLYAAHFPQDARAISDGVESLRRYPTARVIPRVKNSEDATLPKHKGLHGDTGFPWNWFTDRPLPFDRRAVSAAFPWQNNAYELDGGPAPDDQGSGVAYLVAYWLGLYHGFIGPQD